MSSCQNTFGIAEVLQSEIDDRVAGILRPRASTVDAVREVLCLLRLRVPRVDGHEARAPAAQPARVRAIHDRAAGEDHDAVLLAECDRQVFPVQQVAAHTMSPAHMPPPVAERVVLVEQVILAVEEHEPVRVVHEVRWRREVDLRPQRLIEAHGRRTRRLRGQRGAEEEQKRAERSGRAPCHRRGPAGTLAWLPCNPIPTGLVRLAPVPAPIEPVEATPDDTWHDPLIR